VESAKKQLLRFPGEYNSGGAHEQEASEDRRLLAVICDGNQQALAVLYQRRGALLYSMLVRMLGNEMEAQEILQDTFLLIWRRAAEYHAERSSALAWMVMIARGRGWDRLRARARRSINQAAYESEMASLEVEINIPPQAEKDELVSACASALNELPEEQGRALQLAFFRGWTHEEIAGASGEPLGTIKARIRRGLLALRKALKDYHARP
jgi:RNA polymerase sigma-70 factor (ECF subfamily)